MINADWVMQPGFLLQVGIPETGKVTLGTDRSAQVVFRDGQDCTARVRTRARQDVSNLLGVINSDGRTITATDGTSVTAYGQREAWLQAAMQVTPADLDAVAEAADLQNATEVLSWTLQVSPWRAGRDIFNSYDVGDWVGLERPDFSAVDVVRVAAIAVQVAADGSETHELTLVSYIQWLQEQFAYIMNKLGGGLISAAGTTAVAGSITSQNAPTVFSLTLGSLGNVSAGGPGGNAPLVYDPVTGQWMAAGSSNAVTGSVPLSISGPGGQVTIAGDGSAVTVSAPAAPPADVGPPVPVATTLTSPTGTVLTDPNGVTRLTVGLQSDGTITYTESNSAAPATPSTPTAVAGALSIAVGWDGLLGGTGPLFDFLLVEVHVSTSTGFTPSAATLKGTLARGGGVLAVPGLTANTAYFTKLLARNKAQIASAASAQATATPISPGGPKVSIGSTAPVGPATGDLWFDSTNGYELKQWSGAAWVAFQFGTNSIAAGSITAAQIAANTITAAQIAAGTITATQIAASTITTTQIAANTITAADIAAHTITATEILVGVVLAGAVDATTILGATIIADGSSGEILAYSGTPALGNLVFSISPAAGTDGPGNAYLEGAVSYDSPGSGQWIAASMDGGTANVYTATSSAGPWTQIGSTGSLANDGNIHFAAHGGAYLVADTILYKQDPSGSGREAWHDMRPLSNSFVGTVSGEYPPQYKLSADGCVELFGSLKTPPSGSYNGITFFTFPTGYRPVSHAVSFPVAQTAGTMSGDTNAGIPRLFIDTNGTCQFQGISPGINDTVIRMMARFPLDVTGLITS
jgi:hypothetical protein